MWELLKRKKKKKNKTQIKILRWSRESHINTIIWESKEKDAWSSDNVKKIFWKRGLLCRIHFEDMEIWCLWSFLELLQSLPGRRGLFGGKYFEEDDAYHQPGLLGRLLHVGPHQLSNFYNKLTTFPNCFTFFNRYSGKIRIVHHSRERISGTVCEEMFIKEKNKGFGLWTHWQKSGIKFWEISKWVFCPPPPISPFFSASVLSLPGAQCQCPTPVGDVFPGSNHLNYQKDGGIPPLQVRKTKRGAG